MKENSREEDIEELKRFLYRDELTQYGKRKLINYYEQQEKDYKRVLEMNEVLLKENELLRKDIEGWKKYCEEIEKDQTEMSNKNCELEFEVEKLQKENEELKEKNDINIAYAEYLEKILNEYKKESVSKQKVKDKIEEIQEEGYWLFTTDRDSDKCVEVLQELIEEREEE